MSLTIKQVLENLKSLTPSSQEELKRGKNVFEILQFPESSNRIAERLYMNWEEGYRGTINASIVNDVNDPSKIVDDPRNHLTDRSLKTLAQIENILTFEPDPTRPTKETYELLARQLRDYYQRFEDDDDGPWWRR